MKAYRVVPVLTERGECFSIAIAEEGGQERRMAMVFGSRAEAEATVKHLKLLDGPKPSKRS
jgi:hypothetical protein